MNPKNLTQEEILKRIELLAYRKAIRARLMKPSLRKTYREKDTKKGEQTDEG